MWGLQLHTHTGNWLWETPQRVTSFLFRTRRHKLFPSCFSLPRPPPSPSREVFITTAAAPHPVSIHTEPSGPIRGLKVCNCMSVIVWVCVRRCHFVSLRGSRHLLRCGVSARGVSDSTLGGGSLCQSGLSGFQSCLHLDERRSSLLSLCFYEQHITVSL